MSAALAIAARDALRRLAREQDYAPEWSSIDWSDPRSPVTKAEAIAIRDAALATSRGEVARALGHLRNAIDYGTAEEAAAHAQLYALENDDAPIPTATLTAWVDGWDAYAATLTTGCAP